MGENNLINLSNLSNPATVLIEKISDAVGSSLNLTQTVDIFTLTGLNSNVILFMA